MKLTLGLYLNEENGQTFEIRDASVSWSYVIYKDFFTDNEVYSDEQLETLIDWIFEGKISYIGKI